MTEDIEEAETQSLLAALTAARIISDNFAFIRDMTEAVGISGYQVVHLSDRSYVEATRRDGLPPLHIYWGFTTGFTTQYEAAEIGGGGSVTGPSSRPKGTWYLTHPINNVRPSGQSAQRLKRATPVCRKGCGEELPLTGVCSNCD